MAQQLLQNRTPAAYAGVEVFALKHASEDAGALAWLVLGYAHILDKDYAKAVDPLTRAKAKAGDLGDYVNYYLASASAQSGKPTDAAAILATFDKDYPESLLLRDAHFLYASTLMTQNHPQDAVVILEKDRTPIRPDWELILGRAYAASGNTAKAATAFRNLYFTMPLTDEATQADAELKKLGSVSLSAPTFAVRKTRADLLLKGKRYTDAASEYRDLLALADPSSRPTIQMAQAVALQRAGQGRDAKLIFDSLTNATPEIEAERLYRMGEIARSSGDEKEFLRILDQLRQSAPTSTWLEQDLLAAGNLFLLKPDYDRAIDYYRELQQRFPKGTKASYAHWKVAWLNLRQGRNAEAKTGFEQHIALYPASAEVSPALYWRARLAEEDNDLPKARAYYQKLSERFRNYYYGALARQRLPKLTEDGDPAHYALLDRIPSLSTGTKIEIDPVPTDDLRVQKAQLLENGAMLDFALQELRAAEKENPGNWLPAETIRLYQDSGRNDLAVQYMKRSVPNYFAVDLPTLPRPYWEALFPKPYWPDLKNFSSANALDPYLVASLIRQESEFNPNAVSRANALGLMQLLPKTGKLVAKQVKLQRFTATDLFTPVVNLQLGTKYFRAMVDKFGSFEYALAAYNAGDNRVTDWLAQGKYRDPQEFVESIPFTETREYVQAIMRNESVYRQLYGTP